MVFTVLHGKRGHRRRILGGTTEAHKKKEIPLPAREPNSIMIDSPYNAYDIALTHAFRAT